VPPRIVLPRRGGRARGPCHIRGVAGSAVPSAGDPGVRGTRDPAAGLTPLCTRTGQPSSPKKGGPGGTACGVGERRIARSGRQGFTRYRTCIRAYRRVRAQATPGAGPGLLWHPARSLGRGRARLVRWCTRTCRWRWPTSGSPSRGRPVRRDLPAGGSPW